MMKKRIEGRLDMAIADPELLVAAFRFEKNKEMKSFISGCFCHRMAELTKDAPNQTGQFLDALNPPKKLRAAAEGALMAKRIS